MVQLFLLFLYKEKNIVDPIRKGIVDKIRKGISWIIAILL